MNDRFFVYLSLPDYLAQWYVHECEGNGDDGTGKTDECNGIRTVVPKKGSQENRILQCFLKKRPVNAEEPANANIAIVIPVFKGKDTYYYNYLGKNGRKMLVETIRNMFNIQLWDELNSFRNVLARQDNLIYAFMEAHNIDCNEKNWNAIAKIYQRLRNQLYKRNERMKRKKSV